MLKYFPRPFFLSCLLSLSLFLNNPVQAQEWSEWVQSFKDWWTQERETQENDEDLYNNVYILMAIGITVGYFVEGDCG